MPNTNSWLCIYAIAQLGRPYWFATSGQIASPELYNSSVVRSGYSYSNYASQYGQKVHDCSGLIVGAFSCDDVNAPVTNPNYRIANHSADTQYKNDCNSKSMDMNTFPKIPGTLVFRDDEGVKKHVGVYIGTFTNLDGQIKHNAVVEAMGHDYGVVVSDLDGTGSNGKRRWNSWGQLSRCTVDTDKTTTFDARTLGVSNAPNTATDPQGQQVPVQVNIETRNMKPFVATIAPYARPQLDYDRIKEARISIMAFFGGQLFDTSHRVQTYINPNLKALVKDCNAAGMPYALYVHVRASNHIEADKECKALYYIVSQFPPKLGLWLRLQTHNTVSVNDDILELYYQYMEKWGLKSKCGLYVTSEELNKITWDSFKDRYYLWMIDPMDVNEVDDELLKPEMFEVPD